MKAIDRLLKQKLATETETGRILIEMMREYCEKISNSNIDALEIKGMQRLITYIRCAKARFDEETGQ